MNRFLLHIILLLFTFSISAQHSEKESKTTVWKKEKDLIKYTKDKKYKGPINWNSDTPSSFEKEVENNFDPGKYDPQEIRRNREKRIDGEENGDGLEEPDFERPYPDQNPVREEDSPKTRQPVFSNSSLKIIGFVFLFGLVIFIIYSLIKNRDTFKKEDKSDRSFRDLNPESIRKSELEELLEKYTNEENYRECIRIYFTFILKEIIRNGWIKWKKEKTNFDYILEMKKNPDSPRFEESVRIYDLVWYGEYKITKEIYLSLQPILLDYYQSLQKPGQNK